MGKVHDGKTLPWWPIPYWPGPFLVMPIIIISGKHCLRSPDMDFWILKILPKKSSQWYLKTNQCWLTAKLHHHQQQTYLIADKNSWRCVATRYWWYFFCCNLVLTMPLCFVGLYGLSAAGKIKAYILFPELILCLNLKKMNRFERKQYCNEYKNKWKKPLWECSKNVLFVFNCHILKPSNQFFRRNDYRKWAHWM